jgi:hypothetical protein
MARAVRKQIHPYYYKPNPPPPSPRPVPVFDEEGLTRDPVLFRFPSKYVGLARLDDGTSIMYPDTYSNEDDMSVSESPCSEDERNVYKTCIAYEQIGEHHPRILKYLGRDPWMGFPILARPTGLPLEKFIAQNGSFMYPPETTNGVKLDAKYLPLVLQWALHLFSALRFVHSHDIIYHRIPRSVCYLSSDLSLSLVGFLDSVFTDAYGKRPETPWEEPSINGDLLEWAKFYYVLLMPHTGWPPCENIDRAGLADQIIGLEVIRKCLAGQYESAGEAWSEFETALNTHGYAVEGDSLKDFDPTDILDHAARYSKPMEWPWKADREDGIQHDYCHHCTYFGHVM